MLLFHPIQNQTKKTKITEDAMITKDHQESQRRRLENGSQARTLTEAEFFGAIVTPNRLAFMMHLKDTQALRYKFSHSLTRFKDFVRLPWHRGCFQVDQPATPIDQIQVSSPPAIFSFEHSVSLHKYVLCNS